MNTATLFILISWRPFFFFPEDLSWVPAETLAEGPTPETRIGHTATYDPESKRIFVFGGSKHKKWFNDVHILDTQSWRWTLVEVSLQFIQQTPVNYL